MTLPPSPPTMRAMMRSALATLACCVVVLYAVALVVGLMVDGEQYFIVHFAIGFCAFMFPLRTHCLVMTYLRISGKTGPLAVVAAGVGGQSQPLVVADKRLTLAQRLWCGAKHTLSESRTSISPDSASVRASVGQRLCHAFHVPSPRQPAGHGG